MAADWAEDASNTQLRVTSVTQHERSDCPCFPSLDSSGCSQPEKTVPLMLSQSSVRAGRPAAK